jgi:threonine dehydrogenase-like Zn-dependent dehydrogenase
MVAEEARRRKSRWTCCGCVAGPASWLCLDNVKNRGWSLPAAEFRRIRRGDRASIGAARRVVRPSTPASGQRSVKVMVGPMGPTLNEVGTPQTFELCTTLVRAGGHVANIGLHGKPATLHLEDLSIRDITITTGLVETYSTPTLLTMLAAGQLDVSHIVTHRYGLDEFEAAYDTLADAGTSGALKVLLTRN